MRFLKIFGLFVVTALAEIVGCYLPYLWLRRSGPTWILAPAMLSLILFAWLLALHPNVAGRTYAAYGGVYVSVSIAWQWVIEKETPTTRDALGVALCILGMALIASVGGCGPGSARTVRDAHELPAP